EERDVAEIAEQVKVLARVREHETLHHELDVDHAARVVLQVEKPARVGMRGVELLAHGADLGGERARLARTREDRFADALEGGAHGGVARAITRARERLVLPYPGALLLVVRKGVDGAYQQPRGAARPKFQVGLEEH